MRQDLYVSVDVESDGDIPADYSMVSLGAAVAGTTHLCFYTEFKPMTDRFKPESLAVCGLDREELKRSGEDPAAAMRRFAVWTREIAHRNRPVFVGFNAPFDWQFVNWYFVHFLGGNPFGISALDIKSYYMGALAKTSWSETTKRRMEARFLSALPHTHHALDDAREQAELFLKVKRFRESLRLVA